MSDSEDRDVVYSTHDRQIRDGFYREADALLKTDLGPKIEGETAKKIESLLVYLGALFSINRERMAGNPDSAEPEERFNFARGMVACWMPSRENKVTKHSTWGRGLLPFYAVKAIRKCAETCRKFPTEGYIAALASNEPAEYWPGGFLKNSPEEKPAPKSPMALRGEQLAATWRHESEEMRWPPGSPAPDPVAALRAREIQKMIGIDVLDPSAQREREPGED